MSLRDEVTRLLPRLDRAFPTAVLREVTGVLTEHAGARDVGLWLGDYDQEVLGELAGPSGTEVGSWVPVGEGPVGEAYDAQRTVTVQVDDAARVHVPISLRGDRIGVLQATLPAPLEGDTEEVLGDLALTLAYVLSLAPQYTDAFERARRRQPLTVAAEMQWSVLPGRAFSADEFSLAGALIPAYEVGGDVYDFCSDPDALWLAAIDAMGHGVRASVLSALVSHTLRNIRRETSDVVAQVAAADRVLTETFGGAQFVTGVVLQVELDTGRCRFVNAGHPPPFRVRRGELDVLRRRPNVPMGLFTERTFAPIELDLEPGDRLVLVSDGVVEGLLQTGDQYGDRWLADRVGETAGLPTRQAVEALQRDLVRQVDDRLHDDATFVVLDWRGPAPEARRAG